MEHKSTVAMEPRYKSYRSVSSMCTKVVIIEVYVCNSYGNAYLGRGDRSLESLGVPSIAL